MSRRFDGKTVLVTGAGRGQGRAHALAFADEGAELAICDICTDLPTVPYGLSTQEDLVETAQICESRSASVLSERVDVRDGERVQAFVDSALQRFGKLDAVVANAGIFSVAPLVDMTAETFNDVVDVNLKGTWNTLKAVVPGMVNRRYGRVVIIGSAASIIGVPNASHYAASKHAVLGLTKSLAVEHAANGITVNCVCPTGVRTRMMENEAMYALMSPDDPTLEGALPVMASLNAIPEAWMEPEEVSKLVLFLASDDSRYITGVEAKIDMGMTAR